MFKKFKEKLKNWTQKVKEQEEEEEIEEKEVLEEPKQEPEKKEENSPEKEQKEEQEEIELPQKFNVAYQKFEPDTEKLEEVIQEKEEKKGFFKKLKEKRDKAKKKEKTEETKEPETNEGEGFFKKVGTKQLSEKEFAEYAEELEMILLENNVALEVTEKILQELQEKVTKQEMKKKEISETIKNSLKETIKNVLIEPKDIIQEIKEKREKPYVILFCGINGTGKTTTIAKLATLLKEKGITSVLAAGDTFRAASIEQLKHHGKNVEAPVIAHEYGSDPASVGFDAIKYAKKNNIDCVLLDTAGRMHTAKNLLKEMEKIVRVCNPDLKIFIGESITGNDAIEQVKAFNEEITVDGIILTKADIDEKGGTALSLGYITQKPILFLGVGQEYKDLEPFNKETFIEKMGL